MNNKELLIDFIEYAKSRHVMPILHSNIEVLVDDYLRQQNLLQCNVSGELPSSCVNDFESPEYCSQRNNHLCQKCKEW